jgi:hypothetical protein
MQTLKLRPDQLDLIRAGKKRATVRADNPPVAAGQLLLEDPADPLNAVVVTVREVVHTRLADVSDEEARSYGFGSAAGMRARQKEWHPGFADEQPITVVKFAWPPDNVIG